MPGIISAVYAHHFLPCIIWVLYNNIVIQQWGRYYYYFYFIDEGISAPDFIASKWQDWDAKQPSDPKEWDCAMLWCTVLLHCLPQPDCAFDIFSFSTQSNVEKLTFIKYLETSIEKTFVPMVTQIVPKNALLILAFGNYRSFDIWQNGNIFFLCLYAKCHYNSCLKIRAAIYHASTWML